MILLYEIFAVMTSFGCSKCSIFNSIRPSTDFYDIASYPRMRIFLILYGFFECNFFFFFFPARGISIGFSITFPTGRGFWSIAVNWLYMLFIYYSAVIFSKELFSIRKYEGKLGREKGWLTFNLNEGNLKYYINVREDRFVGIFCREEYCQRVQEQWYSRPYIEIVFLSSPIFKFNDYKKKQERNIMITNLGIYNLKGTST